MAKQKRDEEPGEKLDRKTYDRALKQLHVELVKLQEWVKHRG